MAGRDWVGSDVLDLLKPRVKQTARTRRAQQTLVDDVMRLQVTLAAADAVAENGGAD